jgi:IstB-like ATP binding protein/DDE superfamily endonuclease
LDRELAVLGQVELDWVVADEEYGRAGHFLDELEALEQRYVVEVPVTTAVWTADPASRVPASSGRGRPPTAPARDAVRTVAAVAAELPGSAWQALQVRQGAVGPLVFEFAAVRCWSMRHRKPGPPAWLLIRRSLEEVPELKYYISNAEAEAEAEAETPLGTLALVCCTRHRVELLFRLLTDRYERSSVLITSNLAFADWAQVFQGERMTAALLDRMTHRCHIVEMNGESYRFRESMKAKKGRKTG